MASKATTDALWAGGAFALLALGTSKAFGRKRKGRARVYKFPASFPAQWDGRDVELRVGRRYRLPLPQPAEGTYWTLEATSKDASLLYKQKIEGEKGAVAWAVPGGGSPFLWVEATSDLDETKVAIAEWRADGILLDAYEVTVHRK